jgi:hypothetical protein
LHELHAQSRQLNVRAGTQATHSYMHSLHLPQTRAGRAVTCDSNSRRCSAVL